MPCVVTLHHLTLSLLQQDGGTSYAYSVVLEGDALIEVISPLVRPAELMMGVWSTITYGHISSLCGEYVCSPGVFPTSILLNC